MHATLKTIKQSLRYGKRLALSLVASHKLTKAPVWIIEGRERHSGDELRVLFAGSEINKNYIASLCFRDGWSASNRGVSRIWSIGGIHQRRNLHCAIVIVQTPARLRRFIRPEPHFMIPEWVYGVVDLSQPVEVLARQDSSMSESMRKLKKQHFEHEITGLRENFDMFYHTMYRKYIMNRYVGQLVPLNLTDRDVDNCRLILIKQDGNYLGGMIVLIPPNGDIPKLHTLGITDGNHEYIRRGVVHAAYFHSLKYLREQGYNRASIGLSRAFIDDGVFQYKRHWSAEMRRPGKDRMMYALHIRTVSAAAESFLVNNPFIYLDNDTLKTAVFVHHDSPHDIDRTVHGIQKRYHMHGMPEMKLFTICPDGAITPVMHQEQPVTVEC